MKRELTELQDVEALAEDWGAGQDHRHSGQERTSSAESTREEELYVYQIGNLILDEAHFARDAGGVLYVFQEGVYQSSGERYVHRRVKKIVIDRKKESDWSTRVAGQVTEWIRTDAPDLWGAPPIGTLNVLNGLLDLASLKLRPHDPLFLSPFHIPVVYVPASTCPAIDQFIAEVFPEDALDLAFEILGDLLTPERSIQKAVLLVGEGGNGKGVFLALVIVFVGSRNVSNISLHKLEADRFAVARIYAKLANVCADLPSEHLTGTSVFKQITGNDTVTGEYKFRDSFSFSPHCRLLFSANHPPQSKDASKAFYDRWIVVPFNRTFRGAENETPRNVLDARLAAPGELSGALNKAIAALRRLRIAGRFTESESTRTALAQFHAVTDPLAVWLDRQTVALPTAVIPKSELHTAYNQTCQWDGRPPMTNQLFGRALKKLRPDLQEAQRTVGFRLQWVYVGIGLRARLPVQTDSPDSRDSRDSSIPVSCTNHSEPLADCELNSYESVVSSDAEEQVKTNRVNHVNGVKGVGSRPCYACGSKRFWRKGSGELICALCHPPGASDFSFELVKLDDTQAGP